MNEIRSRIRGTLPGDRHPLGGRLLVGAMAMILGGCVMGDSADTGVIDHRHRVFGHDGLYVIDGSAISANPGVNPSLSICALAERAMTLIPPKTSEPPSA